MKYLFVNYPIPFVISSEVEKSLPHLGIFNADF